MLEIIQVKTDEERKAFLSLAQDYVDWMLEAIEREYPELDRKAFRSEHGYDDIRQKFAGEDRLFLAKDGEARCGCVALGSLNGEICEMRTMFVRPEQQGKGTGKALAEATIDAAKRLGYHKMRLDTLGFMSAALGLYRGLGFYEIDAYMDLPDSLKPYIRFLECELR